MTVGRMVARLTEADGCMSTQQNRPLPPVPLDPLAGLLSYLIPGLGQLYQGRQWKGALFLACLYSLFFYGMALGNWRNVFLPHTLDPMERRQGVLDDLFSRPHFAGQVFIGIAAWPALQQYWAYDDQAETGPWFGNFQRQPREYELNQMQREQSKRWDLGWVYTVIAGVLNILVIYDAVAGPAFRHRPSDAEQSEQKTNAARTSGAALSNNGAVKEVANQEGATKQSATKEPSIKPAEAKDPRSRKANP